MVNIQGITYQFKYSCYSILQLKAESSTIILEGIENLDVVDTLKNESQFIQLKYSQSKLSSSVLQKMNTFLNFLEVYLIQPDADIKFRVVTNQLFTDKNLLSMKNQKYESKELLFWKSHFEDMQKNDSKASKWNWVNFNLRDFLGKIDFEIITEKELDIECYKLLIDNYDIITDNQKLFISGLIFDIHIWTRNNKPISLQDIVENINKTKEDIAKGAENDAIKYRWIEPTGFTATSENSHLDYY